MKIRRRPMQIMLARRQLPRMEGGCSSFSLCKLLASVVLCAQSVDDAEQRYDDVSKKIFKKSFPNQLIQSSQKRTQCFQCIAMPVNRARPNPSYCRQL